MGSVRLPKMPTWRDLLMQFFALGSSKIKVCETFFLDIVTTHNDHPTDPVEMA